MARRRRGLSEEDQALWHQVARSAVPMHSGKPPPPMPKPVTAPKPETRPPEEPRFVPAVFRMGESADSRRAHDLAEPFAERLRRSAPKMDRRAFDHMLRGKLIPEARLDLHGMTLSEAHPALTRFILSAQARGLRLVLVITGKGKPAYDDGPIPVRMGALRHQVPQWLAMAPVGPLVLQVAPAHARHGGGGAYYVYLRRLR